MLGRDPAQLARSAADLEARGAPGPVAFAHCDLLEPEGFVASLDRAGDALGGFDTVVITAAQFATQEQLETDAAACRELLRADLVSTVEFCEESPRRLLARGGGTLCVFSSVAGDRARKPVIVYGTAKAGLSYYVQGLDHKFRARGLRTVLVKPGFVKTTMTAGLEPPPFAATAEVKNRSRRFFASCMDAVVPREADAEALLASLVRLAIRSRPARCTRLSCHWMGAERLPSIPRRASGIRPQSALLANDARII